MPNVYKKLRHPTPRTGSVQYKTILLRVLKTTVIFILFGYLITLILKEEHITGKRNWSNEYIFPIITRGGINVGLTDWQRVGSSNDKVFSVYSAYSFFRKDEAGHPTPETVEIITSYKRFGTDRFQCQFYFDNLETTFNTPGVIHEIKGWSYLKKYNITGHTITCKLPENKTGLPNYVSVLVGNQTTSPARLEIQYGELSAPMRKKDGTITKANEQYQFNFSVCVKPVYNVSNDVLHLIEWFEFYKLMGVQQFTFYNLSMGQELSCILNRIQTFSTMQPHGPVVNILPWNNYPVVKEVEFIKNFDGKGKSEVFQECLYRHRGGRSKYLINVDLDEFIMPHDEKIQNYEQLMVKLEETYNKNGSLLIGDYVFKNGFYLRSRNKAGNLPDYCKSQSGNEFADKICQDLWMVGYVLRDPYQPFGVRTKNILKPDGIKDLINHYAIGFVPGYTAVKVAPEIAFSRHYRYSFARPSKTPIVDQIPNDFANKLIARVAETAQIVLEPGCGIAEKDIFQNV